MKIKAFREIVQFEEIEIEEGELISQVEAGKILDLTRSGIKSLLDSRTLPAIAIPGRGKRFTLRSAVEELRDKRQGLEK